MKLGLLSLAAILLWQNAAHVTQEPKYFRFERPIQTSGGAGTRECAALDGEVYAHGAPDLTDLRLFAGGAEVPYVLTLSDTTTLSDAPAQVLNAGMQNGRLVFDLKMPPLAYSSVILQLDGSDFFAEARVTGRNAIHDQSSVALGTFDLFDQQTQHWGRNTTLNLRESTFPFLHVEIDSRPMVPSGGSGVHLSEPVLTANSIHGALVPPSRAAQTLYTTLLTTSTLTPKGNATEALFQVPARVPVERVAFSLRSGAPNFNRDVTVLGKFADDQQAINAGEGEESVAGASPSSAPIDDQQLSVPAVLGLNSRRGMEVEVDVHNGDDRPLPIASVSLQMRQREVCFDAQAQPVTMMYGDPALAAPDYDYARTFNVGSHAQLARLGPEEPNPGFTPRPQPRVDVAERHPNLIWAALLLTLCVLGVAAFSSARAPKPNP
jgi:hypothetical protein